MKININSNKKVDTIVQKSNEQKKITGIINARILDIKKNEVTISFNNNIIMARLKQILPVEIGSIHTFDTSYDESGKLILEFKMAYLDNVQETSIIDFFLHLGIDSNKENIKIASLLLNNNLYLTKENFMKFKQALRAFGENNIKEALFFINNDIPINSKNMTILDNFINRNNGITSHINSIIDIINNAKPIEVLFIGEKFIWGFRDVKLNNSLNELFKNIDESNFDKGVNKFLINNKLSLLETNYVNSVILNKFPENKQNIETLFYDNYKIMNLIENKTEILKELILSDSMLNDKKTLYDNLKNIMNEVLEGKISLNTNNIKDILSIIFKDDLKTFYNVWSNLDGEKHQKLKLIESKLIYNFENSTHQDLKEYLKSVNLTVSKILEEGINVLGEESKVVKEFNKLNNTLDFINQAKDNVFIQVPLKINNQKLNGEIYILKNKKSKENKGGSTSVLIGLDTRNLNRVEIFLQKKDRDISLNFKLTDENIEKLVREKIYLLKEKLISSNYVVNNLTFTELKEIFNTDKNIQAEKFQNEENKLLKIDIRM